MKTEKIELRVSPGEKEWVDLIAKDKNISKSKLIMMALRSWTKENYPTEKYDYMAKKYML